MKNVTKFGMLALLLVSLVGSVFAFSGNGRSENFKGNDALEDALEAGDYDAYLDAFDESDRAFMKHKLTEDQFNLRVQLYDEREERRNEMELNRVAVQTAIEANDYDAWVKAISDRPNAENLLEKITEENFDRFVELHETRQEAKAIADELGLERPKFGNGMGDGFANPRMKHKAGSGFGKEMSVE